MASTAAANGYIHSGYTPAVASQSSLGGSPWLAQHDSIMSAPVSTLSQSFRSDGSGGPEIVDSIVMRNALGGQGHMPTKYPAHFQRSYNIAEDFFDEQAPLAISSVFIWKLSQQQLLPTLRMLPYQMIADKRGYSVRWEQMRFDPVAFDLVPEQGVARTVEFSRRGFTATLLRWARAFVINTAALKYPQGRTELAMKLIQLTQGFDLTCCTQVLQTLLNEAPAEDIMSDRQQAKLSLQEYHRLLQEEANDFCILQKEIGGAGILADKVARVLEARSVPPGKRLTLMPNGARKYCDSNPVYSIAAYTGKASSPGYGGVDPGMRDSKFGELHESTAYADERTKTPIDPMFSTVATGNFVHMDDELARAAFDPSKYRTRWRDVQIYSERDDDFKIVHIDDAFDASGMCHDDDNATLSATIGVPFFAKYGSWYDFLNQNKALDMFVKGVIAHNLVDEVTKIIGGGGGGGKQTSTADSVSTTPTQTQTQTQTKTKTKTKTGPTRLENIDTAVSNARGDNRTNLVADTLSTLLGTGESIGSVTSKDLYWKLAGSQLSTLPMTPSSAKAIDLIESPADSAGNGFLVVNADTQRGPLLKAILNGSTFVAGVNDKEHALATAVRQILAKGKDLTGDDKKTLKATAQSVLDSSGTEHILEGPAASLIKDFCDSKTSNNLAAWLTSTDGTSLADGSYAPLNKAVAIFNNRAKASRTGTRYNLQFHPRFVNQDPALVDDFWTTHDTLLQHLHGIQVSSLNQFATDLRAEQTDVYVARVLDSRVGAGAAASEAARQQFVAWYWFCSAVYAGITRTADQVDTFNRLVLASAAPNDASAFKHAVDTFKQAAGASSASMRPEERVATLNAAFGAIKAQATVALANWYAASTTALASLTQFTPAEQESADAQAAGLGKSAPDLITLLKHAKIENGRLLVFCLEKNVWFPLSFLLFRAPRYQTGRLIHMVPDGRVGFTMIKDPRVTVGRDHTFEMATYTAHAYARPVVMEPEAFTVKRNIFSRKYQGGNGTGFLHPLSESDVKTYRNGRNNQLRDIICVAVPQMWHPEYTTIDITGQTNANLVNVDSSEPEHYPTARIYRAVWGWVHGVDSSRRRDLMNEGVLAATVGRNTIHYRTHSEHFDPNANKWVVRESKDVWGPHVYPGCGRVRNGDSLHLVQTNYRHDKAVVSIR